MAGKPERHLAALPLHCYEHDRGTARGAGHLCRLPRTTTIRTCIEVCYMRAFLLFGYLPSPCCLGGVIVSVWISRNEVEMGWHNWHGCIASQRRIWGPVYKGYIHLYDAHYHLLAKRMVRLMVYVY